MAGLAFLAYARLNSVFRYFYVLQSKSMGLPLNPLKLMTNDLLTLGGGL